MARTVYKGCLPNQSFVGSEMGFESLGTSYMHINSEDEGYRHGILEPDTESDRSIMTKWSAQTKKDGGKLKDQTIDSKVPYERDEKTPRNLRKDVGYTIREQSIESFSSHESDYESESVVELDIANLASSKRHTMFFSNA